MVVILFFIRNKLNLKRYDIHEVSEISRQKIDMDCYSTEMSSHYKQVNDISVVGSSKWHIRTWPKIK